MNETVNISLNELIKVGREVAADNVILHQKLDGVLKLLIENGEKIHEHDERLHENYKRIKTVESLVKDLYTNKECLHTNEIKLKMSGVRIDTTLCSAQEMGKINEVFEASATGNGKTKICEWQELRITFL